ncbi:MAG: PhoX family phosphatase [Rickettsiales bacterium]|nr:PhoX family phosphatase [Rickettsiales bacterium]
MSDFLNILSTRLSRRNLLQAGTAGAALSLLPSASLKAMGGVGSSTSASNAFDLSFTSVAKGYTENLLGAAGYQAQILMRWGDPLFANAADFDPLNLTADIQSKSFGYNNDFIAYMPLNGSSSHGLLHVNHEYTNAHLMFSATRKKDSSETISEEELRIEQAAHGFSMLEVKRDKTGLWEPILDSRYQRRVTATTPIHISGPAAGNARLSTKADPQGKTVLGTVGNCAGGVTPWGTVLVSEENIDGYFNGKTDGTEAENHARYTIAKRGYYGWHRIHERFDITQTPNEPNRFGWVVEYDPYDPFSQPVKRTALGRFKHESATCATAPDGRLVIYSGDDDYFEYIYRFVSDDKINLTHKAANANLLDKGTLSVAKFLDDGSLTWLPLIYGENGLDKSNRFTSQADLLIEARRAGDILGATKMDRPEGIAIQPYTNAVFVSLTRNPKRKVANSANTRAANKGGHIIKLLPPGGDHAADKFLWDTPILAGDPDSDTPDYNGKRVGQSGWFGNPDNLAFHPSGSLWIATDGMPKSYGIADGLYATDNHTAPKCFLRAPKGAEVTGPCFTPDGETLFLSIQHPGEDKGSTFDEPSTRWPDFDDSLPPRPSVIAVTKS